MYFVRGVNEYGDPLDLVLEVCWRCGIPVVTNLVSMDEHVERAHPAPPVASPEPPTVPRLQRRHALPDDREPDPLSDPWRGYPGEPAP